MTHGINPLEYRVLLQVDKLDETIKHGSLTLIKAFESEADEERKKAKEEKATIIAIAPNAFEEWAVVPKIGDRVIIAQFGGRIVFGADGEKYRLVMDKEIEAIINY